MLTDAIIAGRDALEDGLQLRGGASTTARGILETADRPTRGLVINFGGREGKVSVTQWPLSSEWLPQEPPTEAFLHGVGAARPPPDAPAAAAAAITGPGLGKQAAPSALI